MSVTFFGVCTFEISSWHSSAIRSEINIGDATALPSPETRTCASPSMCRVPTQVAMQVVSRPLHVRVASTMYIGSFVPAPFGEIL